MVDYALEQTSPHRKIFYEIVYLNEGFPFLAVMFDMKFSPRRGYFNGAECPAPF
jgi:hypothetical protein